MGWCCRPFRAEGERAASTPQSVSHSIHPLFMQLLAPVSILSFLAKAQGRLRPTLYRQVLASPLVGVRPCSGVLWPWAVLCCCFGRGPSGIAPGALACRAVSLPSSGVVLGFRCGFETSRRPLYGSRFVTVSKHKRSSVSTSRLVQCLRKTGHTVSRLRHTPPKPPSSQKAWRK